MSNLSRSNVGCAFFGCVAYAPHPFSMNRRKQRHETKYENQGLVGSACSVDASGACRLPERKKHARCRDWSCRSGAYNRARYCLHNRNRGRHRASGDNAGDRNAKHIRDGDEAGNDPEDRSNTGCGVFLGGSYNADRAPHHSIHGAEAHGAEADGAEAHEPHGAPSHS